MRPRYDLLPLFLFAVVAVGCGARTSLGVDVEGDGETSEPCRPGSVVVPDGDADRVEIDRDDIYFTVTRNGVGAVLRASLDQPGSYEDVVGDLIGPGDFTIANGALWVTDETRIQRVPLDGGAPTTFYAGEDTRALHIVADESGLYWMVLGTGQIWFQGFGASTPTSVVSGIGDLRSLAVLGENVVFTARQIPFGDGQTNVVASIPKAGGAITVHAADRQEPMSVMQVGERLAWLESNGINGAPLGVYTMPIDGTEGPTLLVGPPEGTFPIVARARGDVVAMTNYDRVSESVLVGASLSDPSRREIDRRNEIFGEPAIAPDFVAWTVLPSRIDPEAADLRWECR
jgi:hypothetical protein